MFDKTRARIQEPIQAAKDRIGEAWAFAITALIVAVIALIAVVRYAH